VAGWHVHTVQYRVCTKTPTTPRTPARYASCSLPYVCLAPRPAGSGHGRRRAKLVCGLLAVAEATEDVGLLGGEPDGGEHGGPAVSRGAADGDAALGPDVGLAVDEEEQDLAVARAQPHHGAPALREPALLLAGAVEGDGQVVEGLEARHPGPHDDGRRATSGGSGGAEGDGTRRHGAVAVGEDEERRRHRDDDGGESETWAWCRRRLRCHCLFDCARSWSYFVVPAGADDARRWFSRERAEAYK